MSISRLATAEPPPGDCALFAALDDAETAAAALLLVDATRISDPATLEGVQRLNELASRLAAAKLSLLAQVDLRRAATTRHGATSTAAWLRTTGLAAGAALREVQLAGGLTRHDATRDALASGRINPEQAAVITGALERLSGAVAPDGVTGAERRLLDNAAR